MRPLDPLNLPLTGRHLLEAGAGTGKTYTLVLLVLRLLLERGLGIDQILVVTFTRAATGELRDRIRSRLRTALDLLDPATKNNDKADPNLSALLALLDPASARQRLRDALVRVDEAAIHTIHGFCERILKEHAFESGRPLAVTLLENELPLRKQIIEDFWRNRFYPVSRAEADWALANWTGPERLLQALGPSPALECDLLPKVDEASVGQARATALALREQVREQWSVCRDDIRHLLEHDPCLTRNDKSYRPDRIEELFAAMDQTLAESDPPLLIADNLHLLTNAGLAVNLKKKCQEPPSHPFFDLVEQWLDAHSTWQQQAKALVLTWARAFLRRELDARKQAQAQLSFDDLPAHLARALERPDTGTRLAARIAERYPAALIDEFQDTDPLQYRIFTRIYPDPKSTRTGVFMIGDPKQAIYAFRGADIFTYIRAQGETPEGHRFSMSTNYRSTPAMVAAVNTVFRRRECPFIFAGIPFQPAHTPEPASAPKPPRPLCANDVPVSPLNALLLTTDANERPISKSQALENASAWCAEMIVSLLDTTPPHSTVDDRPVRASDIAILVRTNAEGEAVRTKLLARGVNSTLSTQASVFSSVEAEQLATVMAALTDPHDVPLLRTALCTDLFGLTGDDLIRLDGDQEAWNRRLAGMDRYRRRWRESGFFPMLHHLLQEERVAARLTARPGGERALTNLLHLAELLQNSPAAKQGMAPLLRWLRRQIQQPDDGATDQLLRLESDEQLVRILTLHRSKGLEFPIVFLPCLWSVRQADNKPPHVFHDRKTWRLTLDLATNTPEHLQWKEEERLAEDLRLLYVGLTRARSACFFCWGRVSGMERTAAAALLHDGKVPESHESLIADLHTLNRQDEPILRLYEMPAAWSKARLEQEDGERAAPRPALFTGRIRPGWSTTSYSRLRSGRETAQTTPGRDEAGPAPQKPAAEDFTSPFTFPQGPEPGTCLHTLLEQLDPQRPTAAQAQLITAALEQSAIDPRWQEATAHWLDAILAAPLPGLCALNQIPAADRLKEPGFLFPLNRVDPVRFNQLLDRAGLAPLAKDTALNGLMKGFIDLVFRYQGRYYLADYKSNYLGPDPDHYGPEALHACMESHQYPLQALIYTLALHRFLRARLAGYDYDTHLGGAFYLFIRAMHPNHPPGCGIYPVPRPDARLIAALDDCFRGGARP
ncbi:MAG: exodeoxyribonuclease V subunit beta [Desulfobulbus sp.]|jgi:exodeoxyribonuclease V beta subunit